MEVPPEIWYKKVSDSVSTVSYWLLTSVKPIVQCPPFPLPSSFDKPVFDKLIFYLHRSFIRKTICKSTGASLLFSLQALGIVKLPCSGEFKGLISSSVAITTCYPFKITC